jgi:protocatechuate 3,4-dioxygenase beta subunit
VLRLLENSFDHTNKFFQMKKLMLLVVSGTIILSCHQNNSNAQKSASSKQDKKVGGSCDGCDIMYAGMPGTIKAIDSTAGWKEEGQRLLVRGTVYQQDGKTPAEGIIIYYHQTDNDGYYSPSPGQDEKSKRHGHIRGWVKTGSDGVYKLYTIKPSPYPGRTIPAHIHLTIKEPGKSEYYIDDIIFDDDPILTPEMRNRSENRAGSGIVKLVKNGPALLVATRDIILGENIPGYH